MRFIKKMAMVWRIKKMMRHLNRLSDEEIDAMTADDFVSVARKFFPGLPVHAELISLSDGGSDEAE